MQRLHLGCGTKFLPGWKHVDVTPHPHVELVATVDHLEAVDNGSVSEIYACHVLEHVGRNNLVPVLREWHRVLAVGGTVRIAVPDWDAVVEYYQATRRLEDVYGLLVGGQRDAYDFHSVQLNFRLLESLLHYCGFEAVQRYEWQSFLPEGFDDYSRCYLPHMDLEGRLMSLNVTAMKREGAEVPLPNDVQKVGKIQQWY